MRTVRSCGALALLLLGACADAGGSDEARKLRAFLEGSEPSAAGEIEGLNAAFAREAVRAWGYQRAGAGANEADGWVPLTTIDANGENASDISPWLDAGDITKEGSFEPCRLRECPSIGFADEELTALRAWTSAGDLDDLARRLSGAALRLAGSNAAIHWNPELGHGMALYPDQDRVDVNPRLLALLVAGASTAAPGQHAAPSPEPALGEAPVETPGLSPAGLPSPPARSHEPPPGYSSDSDDDCDCDCNLIEVRCALAAGASGRGGRAPGTELFFAAAALGLLVRRASRRGHPRRRRRLSGALLGLMLGIAVSLFAQAARAQAPDGAARLEAGTAHLASKDFAAAIGELEAARAAGAGRDVLEPLAKAYEGAGRLPEAYATLGELARDESLKDADRERIGRQAAALEAKLAFLNVQVQPPSATVFVDGQPAVIDPRSKQVVVTPGSHRILARAGGFADTEQVVTAEAGSRNTIVTLSLAATALLDVRAPAPDLYIAIDGVPVGRGFFQGPVGAGRHTVQIYREGTRPTEYVIEAVPGQTVQIPPPVVVYEAARDAPASETPRASQLRRGFYVVGQLGFAFLTARPDGFRYEVRWDEQENREREQPGLSSLIGVTAGMRVSRGVGVGGLLMYGRGGGDGTVSQIELRSTGGTLRHEGPADFTTQFLRLGPHIRFMAGRDAGRFVAGLSMGAVQNWIDLEHVHVVEQGGMLFEQGNAHHDYRGLNPYWGFDLGAEFNAASHLLLGFSMDVLIEQTTNLDGNPFGGTAQGYFGFSARAGYHDWKP